MIEIFSCSLTRLYAENNLLDALKNSTFSGYGKIMYVFDNRLAPKLDQSTIGAGGKVELDTDYWQGVKGKIAYYQTSDLGTRNSNPKKTDAYMFDVDKAPYSLIGEASLEYKHKNTTLLLGRQEIDTPIVSTYEYRIIPNLFEAYTLTNSDLPNTTFTLSYITKMSGLDGLVSFKKFESMSQQTYTSLAMDGLSTIDSNGGDTVDVSKISGDQAVIMSGIIYDNGVKLQAWNYFCRDVLNEFYFDIAYPYNIGHELVSTFEFQTYSVRELGKFANFLRNLGLNDSYELYGSKVSLESKNIGLAAYIAYDRFTGNSRTVTAFGNWGGYPEYVSIPYMFAQDSSVSALAKSQMGKIGVKYNLEKIGLQGQNVIVGYSKIDLDASIMPNSDNDIVNFLYKAKINKSLSLRAQYELRNSKNYRYADDMLTLWARYDF